MRERRISSFLLFVLAAALIVLIVVASATPMWAAASPAIEDAGGPLDYAVYFNDRATSAATITTDLVPMEKALLGFIANAKTSIDAAVYGLNRQSVVNALIEAHQRGVAVRVVGDDDAASGSYASWYQALSDAGVPIVTDDSGYIQHNKFMVFDGVVVWTGSANFTDTGFTLNANNSIVITNTALAAVYQTEFGEMWAGKFHNAKTDNTTHLLNFDGTLVEVYFSPTDNVESKLQAALRTLDSEMDFAMFYWTDDNLSDVVIDQVGGGARVRGVWDQLGAANAYSDDERLEAGGAQIRIEDFAGKVHHKFAVLDLNASDPIVVTGSCNWTASGVGANDENTLIIHDAGVSRLYYDEWKRLWDALGSDVYLPLILASKPTPTPTPTQTPPPPPPTATPAPGTTGRIVITNIFYDGVVSRQEPDEYVEIRNDDSRPIRLLGWTLRDIANHTFTFPDYTMQPGQVCRVYTNEYHPEWCGFSYGSGSAIWNNSGDCAYLKDAQGNAIDQYCY